MGVPVTPTSLRHLSHDTGPDDKAGGGPQPPRSVPDRASVSVVDRIRPDRPRGVHAGGDRPRCVARGSIMNGYGTLSKTDGPERRGAHGGVALLGRRHCRHYERPGGLHFDDLAVHEHDLRGAVGAPAHGALEVEVLLPRTLAAFAAPLRQAGLGAIGVRDNDRTRRSHESEPGWTLEVVGGGTCPLQPPHR